MINEHIDTAKIWETGDDSGLGVFASMEIIIDENHRDTMVDEIQARLHQVSAHKASLEGIVAEEKSLENFLAFAKNSEIVVD